MHAWLFKKKQFIKCFTVDITDISNVNKMICSMKNLPNEFI